MVAHRHGQRWVQDYQQNREELERGKSAVKEGGVYLITGGLGQVGFVLAAYLIEHYHAKLILTGRRELIADGSEGSGEDWMERYKRLKAMSSEVSYFSVDVSEEKSFSAMVKAAEQSVGVIDGVIHAAGNIDHQYFELIEDITIEKAMAMFSPKVAGIENLYRVFKDRDLDFVWLTSSLSTVLGGLGFASYAAANSYMDHFVAARSKELPGWKAVGLAGMAFTEQDIKNEKDNLNPVEIASLFNWSLLSSGSQIIFEHKSDLNKRITEVYYPRVYKGVNHQLEEDDFIKIKRPHLSTSYVEPGTPTEQKLALLFGDFLGIENIGLIDNFFELGGDSLKGMMLLKRIKKEFNVNITLKDFFLKVNVEGIAAKIDENIWINTEVKTEHEIII
ncbi:NAD(P)-dependent dehydrogenase (short-subunit alcohol dehydrogenase family)/acyl carrier protein [Pedobacter sp. UYP1]